MPASFAIAGRCRAAFVEPPVAATTIAAFSNAFLVAIARGRMLCSISDITDRPASSAKSSRERISAGGPDEYGNASPIASATQAMVLAVNWPPQAPAPGQATH